MLGQQCEVHFPEDKEWYKAVVRGYDRASKLHNLWYFYDEEVRTCQQQAFWGSHGRRRFKKRLVLVGPVISW